MRLTYFPGYSYDPKAACNGDTIHLVWWEGCVVSGNIREEVFYKRSTDAGATWEDSVMLSVEDDKSSVLPWIAVNQNYLHVVWQQQGVGICYRKSTNGGNSWVSIDTIPNGGSGNPSICVVDSNVYVVAYRSDGKIIFSKSTDNGNSWLPSQVFAFYCATKPRIKSLGLNQSIIILLCQNQIASVEIYYKKSTDAGSTWSDSQCVSEYDPFSGQWPAMDTNDSSGIHITWFDYKYSPYPWTGDIFYRVSRDSGNTWEPIDSLTVMHRAVASDILAEGNNLHLVWEDDRNGFDNNFEIYYHQSTDLGQTWGSEERLTNALNWSRRPSLACNGRYLHLFWFDLRDDTSNIVGEIYYKRKDLLVGKEEERDLIVNTKGLSLSCPTILTKKTRIYYNLEKNRDGELLIMDITGRVWDKFPVHNVSGEFVFPYNKEVCDGVYFIMLKAGKKCVIKKVVKMQ